MNSGRDGLTKRPVFMARLRVECFPSISIPKFALLDPTLDDIEIQALIGHDILSQVKICLDGPNGQALSIG